MHNLMSQKRPLESHNVTISNKRKRVSFATTTSVYDTDRDVATCQESWLAKETIMDMVRSHPATVQQAQATDPSSFNTHCELLATTYTNSVVHGDSVDSTSTSLPTSASFSCSHLLGMSNSLPLRGLEAFVLSSVASDRMQRRRRHQSTMLKAQVKLSKNTQEERSSLMRQLSERLTASSRMFALAMGAADTYSAMIEHASNMSRLQHDCSATFHTRVTASTTPIPQHRSSVKSALSTSLPMEPAAKRRCTPFKIVSPMA